MSTIVRLDTIDHADLRVVVRADAMLGDGVNQMAAFPNEFEALAREYPIIFRRQPDGWVAVAVLGLERSENLYLDAGGWHARHVPALRVAGPFRVVAGNMPTGDADALAIHVDLDHPRISRSEGEPLFLPHGGDAPYLSFVRDALRRLSDGQAMAASWFAAAEHGGLLMPVNLELAVSDERSYVLGDAYAVDGARLAALDGTALADLNARGFLAPLFHAQASLGNFTHLLARKRAALDAAA